MPQSQPKNGAPVGIERAEPPDGREPRVLSHVVGEVREPATAPADVRGQAVEVLARTTPATRRVAGEHCVADRPFAPVRSAVVHRPSVAAFLVYHGIVRDSRGILRGISAPIGGGANIGESDRSMIGEVGPESLEKKRARAVRGGSAIAMPTVLDWNPAVDPSELVRTIREAIAAGSAVVLPGDCGYVALLNPAAPATAARLTALREPPAVLAWGPDDPAGLGLRLSLPAAGCLRGPGPRRWWWPRPDGPTGRRTGPPRSANSLARAPARFRCPEHPLFEAVTPALEMPLLVVDTFRPDRRGGARPAGRSQRGRGFGGDAPVEGRPTVIAATERGYELTEPGLCRADEVEKLAARIVLFVCTGNTCRSPLAEGLAKQMLAERLGCAVDELPGRGFWVLSAGVSAYGGSPATPEAVAVAAELGADLGEHREPAGQPAAARARPTIVIAMTRGHAQALASRFPGTGRRRGLLCGDADLDDPIGAGFDVYRRCAATIRTHLERFLPEWTGK